MKKTSKTLSTMVKKLDQEKQLAVKGGKNPEQVDLEFTYPTNSIVIWTNGHMIYADLASADFLNDL